MSQKISVHLSNPQLKVIKEALAAYCATSAKVWAHMALLDLIDEKIDILNDSENYAESQDKYEETCRNDKE